MSERPTIDEVRLARGPYIGAPDVHEQSALDKVLAWAEHCATEPTVQVPASLPTREQIAEARLNAQALAQHVIDVMEDDDVTERVQADLATIERVLDSLSQPTMTAERWKERPHEVREDVDDYSMCLCGSPVAAALHDAEPPRIEDLAPGTRFLATPRGWTNPTSWVVVQDADGHVSAYSPVSARWVTQADLDPSTICDVTPPKESTDGQ